MVIRILRGIYNGAIHLALAIMGLGTVYLGGAALLAATILAHVVVLPLVAPYVPAAMDFRLVTLIWMGFAVATMMGIASVLAHPVTWVLDKLSAFEIRFSAA